MPAQISPLISVMTGAARKAAKGLLRDFGEVEQLQVSRKGPADFVSAADHRVEASLLRELRKARPGFGFLFEEQGAQPGEDPSNVWVIDPLDGTTNFLHGIPHFCISIGLLRAGLPYAGVIYHPISDEMYWAEAGTGAWMNNNRLRVSARRNMEECVFGTGFPYKGRPTMGIAMRQVEPVLKECAGVRRMGAAALDLAYVASGRFDGFWELDLKPWDICAGIVLVREAGGLVTELYNKPDVMTTGSILAANEYLHGPLGNIIRAVT
ncbi:MAG TPA: inositol monophosphatase family protein [Magnetospirillaceae bacterium]|jgi:myo-inositol-1(or 4)-monophosphatase